MNDAEREQALAAILKHCGGQGPLPSSPEEVEHIEEVTRRYREAEAEFRALGDHYHCGVPYWMDACVRGQVKPDGSWNG